MLHFLNQVVFCAKYMKLVVWIYTFTILTTTTTFICPNVG